VKINDELEKLYLNHIDYLNKSHREINDKKIKAEGPFLVKCSESNYFFAGKKIVFVGQENNGWTSSIKLPVTENYILSELMNEYEKLKFGLEQQRRPIFGVMHKIISRCNLDYNSCMYLNIWKYCSFVLDKNGKRKGIKPVNKLKEITEKTNQLIHYELKILKPHVVVFFTGPSYDGNIRKNIGDVEFKVYLNYKKNVMSELSFKDFNFRAIRCYHPSYMRRIGKESIFIDEITKFINE